MRVAAIQTEVIWEDIWRNLKNAKHLIGCAAGEGCDLAVLPELFATGVTLETCGFEENSHGPTCSMLSNAARENRICVVGSYIQKRPGKKPYNALVVYNVEGCLICEYKKINLFQYGGEHLAYSPGKKQAKFNLGGFSVSPTVCYDLRFPSFYSRENSLHLVAANWPNPRREHWITLLCARAIETQSYVVGANITGKNPKNTFFGASMIVSPHGEILAQAGDGEEIIYADISLEDVLGYRRKYQTYSPKQ
jgi:omega-amidase